ncbi:hypothetical protein GCM10011529_05060 [Polymorphobacter glacialis]|uniref:Peptidase M56 domain-containing protein n=1 Tax=Sandarakinorhabdus glacialis TaxID=1614636 RepID=A0A917E498_9SPHN|nr:M56 family metallopeptidase [Polymorphobacter glacialis]GGE01689.1 hypothetical protein GCM10011529_05060 [Polymorphobacter glacialis]
MTALIAWGEAALIGSAALMLFVLLVRAPVRRLVGPRLGYALWALPALRMLLPPLPADLLAGLPLAGVAGGGMSILFAGPLGVSGPGERLASAPLGEMLLMVWLAGACAVFATYAVRHFRFCHRSRVDGIVQDRFGTILIIAADVDGPLAFGVFRRFIAVPRTFWRDYTASERDLVIAHEIVHHRRGDLVANWASLVVLAAHWWNPVAWAAVRAFRDDQEFAADGAVLAGREAGALPLYAHVLAKAAGIGALPVCNFNTRSNLKGRLMMLGQKPRSKRRLVLGGAALVLVSGTALAATVADASAASGTGTGTQAVTLGVKPDGSGGFTLIVGGRTVAPGAALPGGKTLPGDFTAPAGCSLKPTAKPSAMVIKGAGTTQTYTVMCASAAPAPVRATLAEGLASLNTMRASVATQAASPVFPEAERAHALGAIDRSIREVEATLAG